MGIRRIDERACTGCGICVDHCPLDVLRLDPIRKIALITYLDDCQSCFLCEKECPSQAIYVTPWRERRTPLAW
jgi:NAD-dependent dihydropyrimidine dehydrogenase PreA subunit